MKKILFVFALLIGISMHTMAQDYTEVVYLKNGSIIRGLVIEQVPNSSLKIQTNDGSIFAYSMDEVLKITKEAGNRSSRNRVAKKTANPLRGYKGFVESGYAFDLSGLNANRLELSTTHGYQFNHHIFVGGGVGVFCFTDADMYSIPVFLSFRANFTKKKITPFVDLRSGYSSGDVSGAFASIGAGVRFALAKKMALNVKLEYQYQEITNSVGYDGGYYWDYDSEDTQAFGIKVGFEF